MKLTTPGRVEFKCEKSREEPLVKQIRLTVYNFDIQSISSIANCIPSCIRHEYFLKHKETRQNKWENLSTIQFYFGKYLFTVKKQYYTYNFQDFLADFGGYLGLLLGYSILGFYDTLTDIANIAYSKRWGHKCVSA